MVIRWGEEWWRGVKEKGKRTIWFRYRGKEKRKKKTKTKPKQKMIIRCELTYCNAFAKRSILTRPFTMHPREHIYLPTGWWLPYNRSIPTRNCNADTPTNLEDSAKKRFVPFPLYPCISKKKKNKKEKREKKWGGRKEKEDRMTSFEKNKNKEIKRRKRKEEGKVKIDKEDAYLFLFATEINSKEEKYIYCCHFSYEVR